MNTKVKENLAALDPHGEAYPNYKKLFNFIDFDKVYDNFNKEKTSKTWKFTNFEDEDQVENIYYSLILEFRKARIFSSYDTEDGFQEFLYIKDGDKFKKLIPHDHSRFASFLYEILNIYILDFDQLEKISEVVTNAISIEEDYIEEVNESNESTDVSTLIEKADELMNESFESPSDDRVTIINKNDL